MSEEWYAHELNPNERPKQDKTKINTVMPKKEYGTWADKIVRVYLEGRGLNGNLALFNDWYLTVDSMGWQRVVIPGQSLVPQHKYWTARAISDKAEKRYLCSKGPRHDAVIICWPFVHDYGLKYVIVEGPMDALAVADCGYIGISLMGNTPNAEVLEQVKLILRANEQFILVPDRDNVTAFVYIQNLLCKEGFYGCIHVNHNYKDIAGTPPGVRKAWLDNIFKTAKEVCPDARHEQS